MLYSGKLNGDFFVHQVNILWLVLCFFLSIIPFSILLLYLIKKKIKGKYISIVEFKHFDKIVIFLLLMNIFFSLTYKVGLYAQSQIYIVPIYLKPIVVLLNKLDMYILSGLLLLSKKFSPFKKVIVVSLLVILSLSKASIFVFLFLFLIFIANGTINFSLKQVVIWVMAISLSMVFVQKLFEYREVMRKGDAANNIEIYDNQELQDFLKSKIIGRVSSLSSVTYFFQNNQDIAITEYQVKSYEYMVEFFRPFYGGFVRENRIGYTYYFTNFFDDNAGIDYGVMYGLPSVFLLSFFKGFPVLLANFLFIIFANYSILLLSSYLFGGDFKEFSFVLLFYPMMSGVSSEFGQILLYLLVLSFLKLIFVKFLARSKSVY